MSLNIKIIKFASITQNNHVYEHTAESPTLKVSLNVRSPYRRQKRDFLIIRSSFRRSHIGIEIFTINIPTILPFSRLYRLFFTFLLSCDYIAYFLPFYLFATISPIFYFFTFLSFCDRLPSYLFATISPIFYLPIFLRSYRLSNNPYSLS
jgi:hypothetical protein